MKELGLTLSAVMSLILAVYFYCVNVMVGKKFTNFGLTHIHPTSKTNEMRYCFYCVNVMISENFINFGLNYNK